MALWPFLLMLSCLLKKINSPSCTVCRVSRVKQCSQIAVNQMPEMSPSLINHDVSRSLEEMAVFNSQNPLTKSYRRETLSSLSVLNPHSQERKKKKICLADITIFLMLTVYFNISKSNFDRGLTNSAEKRWKGWGSCYSFFSNIFSPSIPAAFQSGTPTPCGV